MNFKSWLLFIGLMVLSTSFLYGCSNTITTTEKTLSKSTLTQDVSTKETSSDKTVSQVPALQKTYKITMDISDGKGEIILAPPQTEKGYEKGTKVVIKAVSDDGYKFSQWTGALTSDKSEETVVVYSNMVIGAQFTKTEPEVMLPPEDFIHAHNGVLVDRNGKEFVAKGMAFGNDVWSNPSIPPATEHTEASYKELSELGFNSDRFYMNYGIFEDDSNPYHYKQSGWDWLDKNIAWAKKYNMHLVLNMHYPQGGFQSLGDGMALWTNKDNQLRFIALWKEIARRYKNEPTIMAYDLLNEPAVPEQSTEDKTFAQWENLAKELVSAIREEDINHLIIVERLNASKNISTGQQNWNTNRNGNMNFFFIKDKNIAYEFHLYDPMGFTHQGASWVDSVKDSVAAYPDENAVEIGGSVNWEWFTDTNPVLSPFASDWQYLQGAHYKVTNPKYMVAKPTLQAKNIGANGTVWFDDVVVKEYDEKGNLTRTIRELPFNSSGNWYFWQAGSSKGTGGHDPVNGHDGNGSMKITGTTDDANLGDSEWIKVKQGYSYEISGYAKGKNLDPLSEVRIRLDFYSGNSIHARDKNYLESQIAQYAVIGQKYNVPLYLGEFGCISNAFKDDRGGERWVSDMIDICMKNKISFNYHTYHETAFGLYQNPANFLPAQPNTKLFEVFKKKLNR